MKVKDIIKQLQEQDPDLEIFISSDPEGNNIQEIPEICLGEVSIYVKDGRDIETWSLNCSASDACEDEEKWEEMKKTYPKGIILYP